jgi:tetratricopeptide (TPR) repeat protein
MTKKKLNTIQLESLELAGLCEAVSSMKVPFEDVSALIEDRTYSQCVNGSCDEPLADIKKLAHFFEIMEYKNEENCRDLADIYILIGEVDQYVGKYKDSIDWFKKAAVVFDRYAVPYHNLATSYHELGDIKSAIKSLEQEIGLEPGNYFSYLKLADLYEQQGENEKEEKCLNDLLVRNPENIQALHKLLVHYEKKQPLIEVELLRKRLLAIQKTFSELEIVIRTYHFCREEKYSQALDFLTSRIQESPAMTILYLLKAFVFGELHQFSRKRRELTEFKVHCLGKKEFMKSKLDEFEHVFGKKAVNRLGKILVLSNPNITNE